MESEEIKEKIKSTLKEKYGVTATLQYKPFLDKLKQTCKERYGHEYYTQNKENMEIIKESKRKTIYKRFLKNKKLNKVVDILFSEDEYKGISVENKYLFRCKTCGTEFYDCLPHAKRGRMPRCPKCFPNSISMAESELYNYISSIYTGKIYRNTRSLLKNNHEIDLYLPDIKIAIEFDGSYYHSERNGKDEYYHLNKTEQCENQNIHLIHIFEHDWYYKNALIKSLINNLLNKTKNINIIPGNKCKIKKINDMQFNKFLDNNSLYYINQSDYKFGIYYDRKLYGILSIKNIKNNIYEISNICTKLDYKIESDINLIINYLKNNYDIYQLVYYADRRYYTNIRNNEWIDNNFKLEEIIPPSYCYYRSGFDKKKRKKAANRYFEEELTEEYLSKNYKKYKSDLSLSDNLYNLNFDKVWDCGYLKYSYKF